MFDELMDFTMESITGVFFADYATPELMEDVKRYMPAIVKGFLSIPVRFPWPLNEFALFSFGLAMEARGAFSGVIRGVLEERRADISSAEEDSSSTGGKSAGVLDSLIETRQEQEGTLDDNFIVDSVRVSHLWVLAVGSSLQCLGRSVYRRTAAATMGRVHILSSLFPNRLSTSCSPGRIPPPQRFRACYSFLRLLTTARK